MNQGHLSTIKKLISLSLKLLLVIIALSGMICYITKTFTWWGIVLIVLSELIATIGLWIFISVNRGDIL
jgi:hypothetical protein